MIKRKSYQSSLKFFVSSFLGLCCTNHITKMAIHKAAIDPEYTVKGFTKMAKAGIYTPRKCILDFHKNRNPNFFSHYLHPFLNPHSPVAAAFFATR